MRRGLQDNYPDWPSWPLTYLRVESHLSLCDSWVKTFLNYTEKSVRFDDTLLFAPNFKK